MFPLVSPDVSRINLLAPGGPEALVWYSRRLHHFENLVKETPLCQDYAFRFRWQPPSPPTASESRRFLDPHYAQPRDVELILERSLVKRASRMSSAVWLARIGSPGDSPAVDAPRVVVKFIQPSQLPHPLLTEFISESSNIWDMYETPDFIARREAAGYDRLRDLQGTVIPYFFGKDIILTPSGEPAWAIVTEYIDGESLRDLLDWTADGWCPSVHFPRLSVETLGPIYKGALEGLSEMHNRATLHGDAAPRNLIVPSTSPHHPVWIDLSCMARDVESEAVWVRSKDVDLGEFTLTVLFDSLHCDSCRQDFNNWCLGNIVGHRDSELPFSEEEDAHDELLLKLDNEERRFWHGWVHEVVAHGFSLESNVPSRGLVPRRNAAGRYLLPDPWLFEGEHPQSKVLPIPQLDTFDSYEYESEGDQPSDCLSPLSSDRVSLA